MGQLPYYQPFLFDTSVDICINSTGPLSRGSGAKLCQLCGLREERFTGQPTVEWGG
ncbi:hypothetical protein LIPSTDRAFT_73025, partial [Lipomyces starkeyi NRRL Y-11557]|uniref:Uncharacterized protein n=1 Tax=Lipomyces starkeyi NRRL Y-11557 TaxID=675824 RepID=A0A1E3Q3M3_LIPST